MNEFTEKEIEMIKNASKAIVKKISKEITKIISVNDGISLNMLMDILNMSVCYVLKSALDQKDPNPLLYMHTMNEFAEIIKQQGIIMMIKGIKKEKEEENKMSSKTLN